MHTIPRTIPLPSPPAGQDISFLPSQTDQAIVMAFTARLTTSATVAARLPALIMANQNAITYVKADFAQAQPASLAVTYTWARTFGLGLTAAPVTGQSVSGPLPDAWLQPSDTIGTLTANLAATDQWDQIAIRYYTGEHWLRLQRELREAVEVQQIATALGA